MMPQALIDGDILIYECGFSSDSVARKNGKEHEPLSYCLQNVKKKIESILEATGCDSYRIFLTGPNNFRLEIAPDYKANRDPDHKPHWYKEIKEYLIEKHGAEITNGFEADDAMGWNQTDDTIICTKDKDLDMVPGKHYNWSPKKIDAGVYHVTEVEGLRFFYTQCLTGDSTDNIPGLFKLTGQRATKKIKAPLQDLDTEEEMWVHVVHEYHMACMEKGIPTPDVSDKFRVAAACLWISHGDRETWEPPT
jgi:5'-3' exonuclease